MVKPRSAAPSASPALTNAAGMLCSNVRGTLGLMKPREHRQRLFSYKLVLARTTAARE